MTQGPQGHATFLQTWNHTQLSTSMQSSLVRIFFLRVWSLWWQEGTCQQSDFFYAKGGEGHGQTRGKERTYCFAKHTNKQTNKQTQTSRQKDTKRGKNGQTMRQTNKLKASKQAWTQTNKQTLVTFGMARTATFSNRVETFWFRCMSSG